MKNKRSVKGAKAGKTFTGKASTTTKKTITAKGRSGASKVTFLKVPTKLVKCLTEVAAADKDFKGSNWQRYAINQLKEIAAN